MKERRQNIIMKRCVKPQDEKEYLIRKRKRKKSASAMHNARRTLEEFNVHWNLGIHPMRLEGILMVAQGQLILSSSISYWSVEFGG